MVHALGYLVTIVFAWGFLIGMEDFDTDGWFGFTLLMAAVWPVVLVFVVGAYLGQKVR